MYYFKEIKKPNRILGKILLTLCKKYLYFKIDIHVEENETKNLKSPYLILGNHVSYWDPFLINMFIGEPMCYIAAAVYFRNPILRFFLNLAGSIPKKKFMTQYSPVKRLIQAKNNGRILGIFPEGERKWDGTTDEMVLFSTAKLIKKLDVPVVVAKIKGGYLAYPRWAKVPRKGRVSLSYKLCIKRSEIQKLTITQIEKRIREFLSHDEIAYQKEYCNTYLGDKLAENLEHFLFGCPHCELFNTLVSNGNLLRCNHCNYGVLYNQYGFLEGLQGKLYFDNVRDWNRWQNHFLKDFISKKLKENDQEVILRDKYVELAEGSFTKPFGYIGQGNLGLYQKGLNFSIPEEEKYQFELKWITGLNVQFQAVLEFNYKENMYRFQFKDPHISAYKWVQAIHYMNEEISELKKTRL